MFFGTTDSACSLFLRFAERTLAVIPSKENETKLSLPTRDEVSSYQRMIFIKYPSLSDVYTTAVGLT